MQKTPKLSMPELAEQVAADLVGRVRHVTRCYGNQRRAENAALDRVRRHARAWGYTDAQAEQAARDTLDLAALQGYYRD